MFLQRESIAEKGSQERSDPHPKKTAQISAMFLVCFRLPPP